MPQTPKESILREFRFSRLIIPILIGLGVLAFAIYRIRQEGVNPLTDLSWTPAVLGWTLLGLLFMAGRDLGYIWRMRLLTDQQLSWKAATEVTLLWEFASAMTPSVVGGSALAIFMLIKEKISAGRSTAIVFVTIFLDEVFYILVVPLAMLLVDFNQIFEPILQGTGKGWGQGIMVSFWIAYGVLTAYTTFLGFALFLFPKGTNRALKGVMMLPLIRRWRRGGIRLADELLLASEEFRTKSWRYWLNNSLATLLAWVSRYLVLNCVLAAFATLTYAEHLIAFARQSIQFILMIVAPTPGGSGVAETVFSRLYEQFAPMAGTVLMLAAVWRLLSYYPYLFIGIPLLPRWLRRVFAKDKDTKPPE